MISNFYTTTFTAKRMVYTGDKSALSSITGFNGHIQQLTQEKVAELAGALKVSHSVWCPVGTSVQLGDQITENGNTYAVRAIQKNNVGNNTHLELLVEK